MGDDLGCPIHGRFHQVFLSYRRQDGEDLACHVAESLRARDISVFWDQHCLGPGVFADKLPRFEEGAVVFMPIVTPGYAGVSGEPDFCLRELESALAQGAVLVPLMKTSHKTVCFRALAELDASDPRRAILNANILFIDSSKFANDLAELAAWVEAAASGLAGETANDRHFANTFPDLDDLRSSQVQAITSQIHAHVDASIRTLVAELQPKIDKVAEGSVPELNREDSSLYTGVGGLALAFWSAAKYLERVDARDALAAECFAHADRALRLALELVSAGDRGRGCAFYCGAPGVHALAAMIHGERDPASAAAQSRLVLAMLDRALADPETELLYGRAGYLYSLLVLRRHTVPARRPASLDDALNRVFDSVLADCRRAAEDLMKAHPRKHLAQGPLAVRFPAGPGGWTYFGAAHGLAGVLYVLLHLSDRCLRPEVRPLIVGALDFLVSIQLDDGNFPTAVEPSDALIHWCHGAPGIIPTLCKAYEVFGDGRYLSAARRAADCVWAQGLLRKGTGVCHGIAGSALSQLSVYRAAGSQRDLYRALRLCEATWSARCLRVIDETPDSQRRRPGLPDYPYSLMEGRAGVLYAYAAIQRPDQSSFPGYDGAT